MTTLSELDWFKSSYSGGSGTECVECAYVDDNTLIRDSKLSKDAVVHVQAGTWHDFIQALRRDALS
ncbi:DUF397 domain-containing protein [Streptomyces sp. NPDC003697]